VVVVAVGAGEAFQGALALLGEVADRFFQLVAVLARQAEGADLGAGGDAALAVEGELAADIARVEAASAAGQRLTLRIALDYSSREAITRAAASLGPGASLEDLDRRIAGPDVGPVDLMIRTGGEQRLSDFLLWESAYAELRFTDRMWPDFEAADLAEAILDFRGRVRTFGAAPEQVALALATE